MPASESTLSSSTDSHTMSPVGLPQHLLHNSDPMPSSLSQQQEQRRSARRSNGTGSIALSMALALLATTTGCNALSTATTALAPNKARLSSPSSSSPVNQALMIRKMRTKQGSSWESKEFEINRRQILSSLDPSLDNEAWVAALFDDSGPSQYSNMLQSQNSLIDFMNEKRRAEEFDRFMEEDADVASIVKDSMKKGSLVDEVQQAKGADIDIDVDVESLLQEEAMKRRRLGKALARTPTATSTTDAAHSNTEKLSSCPPRKSTKAAFVPREETPKEETTTTATATTRSSSSTSSNTLLTREHEYKLAHAIQRGAHVHKIKAQYESTHSRPLSKKQWATLANIDGGSPNELRKIVSEYRRAKQELVSSNMGLVYAVVKNYRTKAKIKGITQEELVQEGSLGLIRAAELFDPEKGLRFSTYATIWIKGVLSNYSFGEIISLPQREKAKWNKIQMCWKDMSEERGASSDASVETSKTSSMEGGATATAKNNPTITTATKKPSTSDISKQLGMKSTDVENTMRRMSCARNVLSLDYQYTTTTRSGDANTNRIDAMQSCQSDADLAERTQLHADVVATLVRNLNEKEVTLMRLRYGLLDGQERTVKECASVMGINRETARKLQHACLQKLREARDAESLQEYLLTVA